ncbi:hypothetical protein GJAV_G00260560 [Gymnothorax javanicus]|nr:hypothetical protein GJAV_G00260560 [Gymnothorax javanicus]
MFMYRFRERLRAIEQVVDDCKVNLERVTACILPVDSTLLAGILAAKAQLVGGQAKIDLTELIVDGGEESDAPAVA